MDTTNPTQNAPVAAPATETPKTAGTDTKPKFKFPKQISIKGLVITIIVLAVLGLLYYYKGAFIAATVDGKPISRLSVIKELEKQSGRETLDSLISKALINNEAKKKGVNVPSQEIDSRIREIEDQIKAQGSTLDDALQMQGVSREELRDQIELQVKAEEVVKDKISVTDEEIAKYITDSGITVEAGKEEETKAQARDSLKQQKFSSEIASWLDEARKNASIKEFVNY
jgi:foldase protein PrsA